MTLTSILITESDLEWLIKCISKLHFANEIIISDNGSDFAIEGRIKQRFPQKNIKYFFDSDIDPRVKYFKYGKEAVSDYVHLIHPDEIYSEELANEIIECLSDEKGLFDAFAVRPTNIWFGTDFGKADSHTVRIFKKEVLQIANKNNVHAEIFLNGSGIRTYNGLKIKLLEGDYVHYANPYLLLLIVKTFRYEMINAKSLSNDVLLKRSIDKNGMSFWELLKLMIKINLRFFRAYRSLKKYKYGGLAMSIYSIFRTIAEAIAPTEELMFREDKLDFNDTRGYINLKREKWVENNTEANKK